MDVKIASSLERVKGCGSFFQVQKLPLAGGLQQGVRGTFANLTTLVLAGSGRLSAKLRQTNLAREILIPRLKVKGCRDTRKSWIHRIRRQQPNA